MKREDHPDSKDFIHKLALIFLMIFALLTTLMVVHLALGMVNPAWTIFSATAACFLFTVFHAGARLGWKQALTLVLLSFLVSLLFESVGVGTGWIFGPYHYSENLGLKFLGLVPYIIPFAWFMMMYPAFLMAHWLAPKPTGRLSRALVVAATTGVIMTSWDLLMDPLMVQGGHWVWEIQGAYFGIPIQNFWGWWLTTFVIVVVFLLLSPEQIRSAGWERVADGRWDGWAFLSFFVTGLGSGVAAATNALAGPALVGLFAMGPWLLLAGWKTASVIHPSRTA